MALFPNEEYLIRKETLHKNKPGTLGLTNLRLIWSAVDASVPGIMMDYHSIDEVDDVIDPGKTKSILKIAGKDPSQKRIEVHFAFISATHQEDLQICKEYIYSYKNKHHKVDEIYFLAEDTQQKIKILKNDPDLAEIHRVLVREGDVSEEEFWEASSSFQKYSLEKRHSEQIPGKLSSIVRIPHRFIPPNQIAVDLLNKHKELIFRQLPDTKQHFIQNVPHKKSEKDFWKHFWEKQLSIGTVMSDALELTSNFVPECPIQIADESLPSNYGNYRTVGTANPVASQIIQHLNQHSAFTVKLATFPPPYQTPVKKEFKIAKQELTEMQIDAPAPEQSTWLAEIKNCTKAPDVKTVFPTIIECGEAMKQIFHQIISDRDEAIQDDTAANELARKVYEILKHFYAEFPISGPKSIARMEKIVEIANKLVYGPSANISHELTLDSLRGMVHLASERLNQIKST